MMLQMRAAAVMSSSAMVADVGILLRNDLVSYSADSLDKVSMGANFLTEALHVGV